METLAGVRAGLTPTTLEDLAAICLLGASVNRRVEAAAAKAVGPGDDFSGHSGRAGLVHRMAGKKGVDPRSHPSGAAGRLPVIMCILQTAEAIRLHR